MDLEKLQEHIKNWDESHFPSVPSQLALIKIMEELGELASHYVDRTEERVDKPKIDHQTGIEDAVADVLISLSVFCVRE